MRYDFTVSDKNTVPALEVLGALVRNVHFSEKALGATKHVGRGELERRAAKPSLLLLTDRRPATRQALEPTEDAEAE